jgi:hypothetical protein
MITGMVILITIPIKTIGFYNGGQLIVGFNDGAKKNLPFTNLRHSLIRILRKPTLQGIKAPPGIRYWNHYN